MDTRLQAGIVAAVLLGGVCVGAYSAGNWGSATPSRQAAIETCDSLPDYHFERALARVERIKGMQLRGNLSICVESSENGIDTTPDGARFAYVTGPGLSFFGLDATTNARGRSSLGYTSFSRHGGPIRVVLADRSVVRNVSWISYDALVAHELSHAIDDSHLRSSSRHSGGLGAVRRTTDWLLANRAIKEGSATYVSERYVEQYGGTVNVSELTRNEHAWKHRILVAVYAEGYRYSDRLDVRASNARRVNSTAAVLHSGGSDPAVLPSQPRFSATEAEHVRTDRIGELFLRETFVSKGIRPRRAAAAAEGWRNDRMDYYRANGSTIVTWRVTWRNASERAEFVDAYRDVYDFRRVDALRSVRCRRPGRYLMTSNRSVTIVSCGE